jgi:hypothetical protein
VFAAATDLFIASDAQEKNFKWALHVANRHGGYQQGDQMSL